jgi:LuxR family maltose regulon positive regulatory protein
MVESPAQTVTASPLLETKLYAPRWRPGLVSRPRLIERLGQGANRKLTLVSAPAGFGKSTLLAEWLAASANQRPAAWVSLDPGDNDPSLFWAYFIAALQTVRDGVGARALSQLHSSPTPPVELVLTTLINEINAIEDDFALILDDFHVIDAPPVHSATAFLLEHMPPQMHLVIASRSDPPLPLIRLRGRGESVELRAPDLRFTADEAADFLSDVMDLELSPEHMAALETRTEGWIAGLQLAALSMQGRDDVSGFISAFTGDDRYIVDYLVEEVLQRQPERIRSFLLQTSVLDRLSGPLCDNVTGQQDGKQMLETLERGNLFLVPLDGNRQWYRYHHLFGEVLFSRLREEHPGSLSALHRQAGDWYATNGLPADVVRHALAGGDFDRAAAVMELETMAMVSRCEEPTLIEWFKQLPEDVLRARPVLTVYYAFIALNYISLDVAEDLLRDAERLLDIPVDAGGRSGDSTPEIVIVDEKAFRSLPGSIAVVRAFQAGALGDTAGTLNYARQALDHLQEDDYFWRGAATAFSGISYWTNGDLEAAHGAFTDGIATLRMVGDTDIEVSGEYVLANIRVA